MATSYSNTVERTSGMEIQSYQIPENAVPLQQWPITEDQQEGVGIRSSGIRERGFRTTIMLEITQVDFKLFMYAGVDDAYILEEKEVSTGLFNRYWVQLHKENGYTKGSLEISALPDGEYNLIPILEDDPTPQFPRKSQFPLSARLGGWIIERRKRTKNGREESFYSHRTAGKIRSFIKVVAFIIFACDLDVLGIDKSVGRSEQVLQPQAYIMPALGGPSIGESSVSVQLQKVSSELEEIRKDLESHRIDSALKMKLAEIYLGKEKSMLKRRKIEELDAKIRAYREQEIAIMESEIESEYRQRFGVVKRVSDLEEKRLSNQWTQKHCHLANLVEQIGNGQ